MSARGARRAVRSYRRPAINASALRAILFAVPSTPDSQQRVHAYFRVKQRQLATMSGLPACEHGSLSGGHREELQRVYLREILPRRFEVGRGMIYGIAHRSREADVAIWDAQAFPSLPMLDHSFFFAESGRAVIESKSRWSDQDFHDVLKKSRAIRDIIPMYRPSLAGDVEMLQLEIEALKRGVQHDGMLHVEPHIGTGAIFLRGGATGLAAKASDPDLIEDADDSWPDLVLLVEPGHLVVKDYTDGVGHLLYYELGEDALLAFTNGLLVLLNDRSVHLREPLYLSQYAWDVAGIAPVRIARFPITRPTPMRVPLWR